MNLLKPGKIGVYPVYKCTMACALTAYQCCNAKRSRRQIVIHAIKETFVKLSSYSGNLIT